MCNAHIVNTQNKNSVWLKLRKDKFDEPEDIFIGTFYLSPESYEKQMKSNYMDDLEKEIFRFSSKGKVIIQGDFNARCANLQDTVEPSKIFDQNNVSVNSNWVHPLPATPGKIFLSQRIPATRANFFV